MTATIMYGLRRPVLQDESRDEFRKHTEPVMAHGQRVEAEGVRQRKGSNNHSALPVGPPRV